MENAVELDFYEEIETDLCGGEFVRKLRFMRNLRLNRGESIKHDVIKLKMSISTRRLIFSIYKRTAPTTTNKKWCSTSPPTPVPIIRRKGKGDREMVSK